MATRCRALFATHYHELTALAQKLDRLACHTMRIKEWQGEVVFLHEVAPGAADRSYGIHVARLAGLPEAVLARAEEVLALLEQGEKATRRRPARQRPAALPGQPAGSARPCGTGAPTRSALASPRSTPTTSRPRDALELVYALRRRPRRRRQLKTSQTDTGEVRGNNTSPNLCIRRHDSLLRLAAGRSTTGQ